jgi:hypothetical protein
MRSLVICIALVLCPSLFGAYTTRLFFRNSTTGATNAGAVLASPGDVVEVWFTFHKLDNVNPFKWGTLQLTMCLDGLTLVSAADQANWYASIETAKKSGGPAGDWLTSIAWSGELRDSSIDPTDPTALFLCGNGLYFLLGVEGTKGRDSDWDVMIWKFTVQAGSEGQVLDWFLDGRNTPTGLSTRILDQKGKTIDLTDNWVSVVPEPGVVGGFGVLFSLLALRRRR